MRALIRDVLCFPSSGEYCRCVQQELCYQLHLLQKRLPSLDPGPLLNTLPQQSIGWEGEAVKTFKSHDSSDFLPGWRNKTSTTEAKHNNSHNIQTIDGRWICGWHFSDTTRAVLMEQQVFMNCIQPWNYALFLCVALLVSECTPWTYCISVSCVFRAESIRLLSMLTFQDGSSTRATPYKSVVIICCCPRRPVNVRWFLKSIKAFNIALNPCVFLTICI